MKIDRKIFYISLFLLLFFSACFYLFIPDFVSKTFDSLEQNSVVEESGKMRYFIIQEVSRLDSINLEWSKREDLYKFFSKSTDDQDIFVSNDFDFQYLKDSKIDYLALINNNGELLYNIEINNGLVQSGISNDFLGGLCGSAVLKNCTGLISWQGDKIAAISIRPVSKGDDFFPIGHIVMLRFFDEKVTTYDGKEFILKKIIDVDKKVEDSESVLFVDKVDANMLNIYSFYDDVLGKRSFYSKIPMERTIYKSEKLIMGVISYSVLILQLLMIISFLFIIKRMIVERLNLLVFSIQSILKSKKREKTIIFNGNFFIVKRNKQYFYQSK
ncbi:hypothetical protein M0Q03_00875 [bacterium]|jgi:hypothetical protein|nr:hypothetical protein [bacterium]